MQEVVSGRGGVKDKIATPWIANNGVDATIRDGHSQTACFRQSCGVQIPANEQLTVKARGTQYFYKQIGPNVPAAQDGDAHLLIFQHRNLAPQFCLFSASDFGCIPPTISSLSSLSGSNGLRSSNGGETRLPSCRDAS